MLEIYPKSNDVTPVRAELRRRLLALVTQVLGTGVVLVDPACAELKLSDLGVSSLKMVNLMLALEVEFELVVPQVDITPENFHSIMSIEAMLERLLPAATG